MSQRLPTWRVSLLCSGPTSTRVGQEGLFPQIRLAVTVRFSTFLCNVGIGSFPWLSEQIVAHYIRVIAVAGIGSALAPPAFTCGLLQSGLGVLGTGPVSCVRRFGYSLVRDYLLV